MKKYRYFWSAIPKASDIKVIKSDGTVEHIKVNGKKDAARIIRRAQRYK